MKKQFIEVRELLSDPARWTQGSLAKDIEGNIVPPYSYRAVCWCLLGAMEKYELIPSRESHRGNAWFEFSSYLNNSIGVFNDHSTHKQVLKKLDAFIATLSDED